MGVTTSVVNQDAHHGHDGLRPQEISAAAVAHKLLSTRLLLKTHDTSPAGMYSPILLHILSHLALFKLLIGWSLTQQLSNQINHRFKYLITSD